MHPFSAGSGFTFQGGNDDDMAVQNKSGDTKVIPLGFGDLRWLAGWSRKHERMSAKWVVPSNAENSPITSVGLVRELEREKNIASYFVVSGIGVIF